MLFDVLLGIEDDFDPITFRDYEPLPKGAFQTDNDEISAWLCNRELEDPSLSRVEEVAYLDKIGVDFGTNQSKYKAIPKTMGDVVFSRYKVEKVTESTPGVEVYCVAPV